MSPRFSEMQFSKFHRYDAKFKQIIPHIRWIASTCFLIMCSHANAAVFIVALDGTGDFDTIQAAIDATVEGDIVEVADGVYTGPGNRDLTFPEWPITVRSANGPEFCTIDCMGEGRAATISSGGTIEGFRITGADFGGQGTLYCVNDAFVLNCIIRDNDTRGITFGPGLTIVRGCDISHNSVSGDGGGIACYLCTSSAQLIVEDTVISQNTGYFGGAFNARLDGNTTGSATFRNCRIFGNHAKSVGGALNINIWDVYLYDTIISQNTAGSKGGAVYIRGGGFGARLYAERCTIFDNSPYWRIYSNSELVFFSIIRSDTFAIQGFSSVETAYSHIQNMDQLVDVPGVTVVKGPGNLRADPLLSTGFGQASLMPGSPAINAGNPEYTAESGDADIEGDPRVLYGRLDIGANEWFNPGDYDGDGDVDLADFAYFQICFTGSQAVDMFVDECVVFDGNRDRRVDLDDFGEFQLLYTGPK